MDRRELMMLLGATALVPPVLTFPGSALAYTAPAVGTPTEGQVRNTAEYSWSDVAGALAAVGLGAAMGASIVAGALIGIVSLGGFASLTVGQVAAASVAGAVVGGVSAGTSHVMSRMAQERLEETLPELTPGSPLPGDIMDIGFYQDVADEIGVKWRGLYVSSFPKVERIRANSDLILGARGAIRLTTLNGDELNVREELDRLERLNIRYLLGWTQLALRYMRADEKAMVITALHRKTVYGQKPILSMGLVGRQLQIRIDHNALTKKLTRSQTRRFLDQYGSYVARTDLKPLLKHRINASDSDYEGLRV